MGIPAAAGVYFGASQDYFTSNLVNVVAVPYPNEPSLPESGVFHHRSLISACCQVSI